MKRLKQQQSAIASRTVAVMGAFILALSGSVVYAGTQCYDFSGPAPDTTYQVGQTVNAKHSVIHLHRFQTENGPSTTPNPEARIVNSVLSQGQVPSLSISQIVTQVVPQKRVQRVTLKFAENTGLGDNQLWNFGVNGEQRIWHGQLAHLNGQKMGQANVGGRVRVSVDAVPDSQTLPTWVRGTLTLEADPTLPLPNRGIQTFSIGRSSTLNIDDVCVTE